MVDRLFYLCYNSIIKSRGGDRMEILDIIEKVAVTVAAIATILKVWHDW